jgi:hypothetical protein
MTTRPFKQGRPLDLSPKDLIMAGLAFNIQHLRGLLPRIRYSKPLNIKVFSNASGYRASTVASAPESSSWTMMI